MRARVSSSLLLLMISGVAVDAVRFTFRNLCPFAVDRWDNSQILSIPAFNGVYVQNAWGAGLMWRNGYNPEATLAEATVIGDGRIWYDISVIPPGTFWCSSYDDCQLAANGRKGFNTAMAMIPLSNDNGFNCRALYCMHARCDDAYLFPRDNTKVHNCPDTTDFDIVFCPGGVVSEPIPVATTPAPTIATTPPPPPPTTPAPATQAPTTAPPATPPPTTPAPTIPAPTTPFPTTDEPPDDPNDDVDNDTPAPPPTSAPTTAPPATPAPYVRANFEYWGAQAGNVPGSYLRTTDLATCSKQRIDVNNPVGPLSEEVSMIFRGPMDIYNIAVFDASATSYWQRVSWYKRTSIGITSDNLVFFNNKNPDYSGLNRWGPQIFSSGDGNGTSTEPVTFLGKLVEANDTTRIGGGPGIDTGVEVNILTARKCLNGDDCKGFHGDDYSYHGWGGGRKIFVTRVRMPMSGRKPNLPAIWMLNTQTMYTGQYSSCNCRGWGAAGGCGELDIAEVIQNQNPGLDKVSTHHYFYDGTVPNPLNGDNFASRPTTRPATYVTIIDQTVKQGLIKVIEIDYFNFSLDRLNSRLVQRWIDA